MAKKNKNKTKQNSATITYDFRPACLYIYIYIYIYIYFYEPQIKLIMSNKINPEDIFKNLLTLKAKNTDSKSSYKKKC